MPAVLRRYTVADLDRFPRDGNRYELVEGILLVTPGPGHPHQSLVSALLVRLASELVAEPDVRIWSPGTVEARPDLHLEPDLLVGSRPAGPSWEDVRTHWLAVEVSGQGSRVYDREYKRDAYLAAGVQEVWVIDLKARTVETSRPDRRAVIPIEGTLVRTTPAGRRVTIAVAELFRDMVWPDDR
ncbi:MAG: Uma2 family endonuclease [Gemmatimonadales bacterium]